MSSGNSFKWKYVLFRSLTQKSLIEFAHADPAQSLNFQAVSANFEGVYYYLAHSLNCLVTVHNYTNISNTLSLLSINSSGHIAKDSTNLDTLLTGNVNGVDLYDPNQWAVSDDCMSFRVGDTYWSKATATASFAPMTHAANFSSTRSQDPTFTYTVSGGDIYKFDTTSQGYKFFASAAIPNNCKLTVYQDRLFIDASTSSAVDIYAYTLSATSATQVFNFSLVNLTVQPKVSVSPQLTKVVLAATGANSIQGKGFHIDWTNQNVTHVTFPYGALRFGLDYFIAVGENSFYLRELRYEQNYSWIPSSMSNVTLKEAAYYVSQSAARLVFSLGIIPHPNFIWKFNAILANSTGEYLYSEMDKVAYNINGSLISSYKVINVTIMDIVQALFNSDYNGTYTTETVGGDVQVCPPGCVDCTCSVCLDKYVQDPTTGDCMKCGPGCLTCNSNNVAECTTCTTGLYFDPTTLTCRICDTTCLTCGTTANTCEICYPGLTFVSGQCIQCPQNCFNCTSTTSCNFCDRGYGLTSAGVCRKCLTSCS